MNAKKSEEVRHGDNLEEIREEAFRQAESRHQAQLQEEAILWAFTTTRLLRTAVDSGEEWAVQFKEHINRELDWAVPNPGRLADLVARESANLEPHMRRKGSGIR